MSYAGATVGVLAAVVALAAWILTGRTSHLVASLAFAALVPAWYLRPVSFTRPVGESSERRAAPLPKLVQGLAILGFILLGTSIVMRFA